MAGRAAAIVRRSRGGPAPRSGARLAVSSFLRHRAGMSALGVVLLLVGLAVLAPVIAPYDWNAQDIPHRFGGSSPSHALGTDELGRDILSRILYGARFSLSIGVTTVALALAAGTAIGTVAGYYRRLDGYIMRGIDVMMAFPGILLAIAIVAALGPGLVNVIVAIFVNEIPAFARLTRGMVLSLREREFVTAARVIGARNADIVRRHILVNLASPLIVFGSLRISTAILVAATLSFLGLGIQPPTPEWGAMVSTARQYIAIAPHTFVYPTLAIFVAVIAFNVLGDALRDTLDPTTRT
jgi:peptide/nickel transport system permease protein